MNILCNMCGLSCFLGKEGEPCARNAGLINARVDGGYNSTPGNGNGALDDMTSYRFSMCEFCLDWLFSRFVLPVAVGEYDAFDGTILNEEETWRPAHRRVNEDDWRKMKEEFRAEYSRRAFSRKQ